MVQAQKEWLRKPCTTGSPVHPIQLALALASAIKNNEAEHFEVDRMTKLDPEARAKIARQFTEAVPHAAALNMTLLDISDGHASIRLPFDKKLIGDPNTGVIAGGAVSALLDTAGGAAVMCHPDTQSITATLDLRIDYMRPATPGQDITAHAECYHVTRSVAFVRSTAFDDDSERPVATATGAFTVIHPREAKP